MTSVTLSNGYRDGFYNLSMMRCKMATNVKKLNPKKFPVQKETASLAECDVRIAELANYKAD